MLEGLHNGFRCVMGHTFYQFSISLLQADDRDLSPPASRPFLTRSIT